MTPLNPIQLATYILVRHANRPITPMKLQKLAYYTKVWTLVAEQPFVNADFQKWQYGPVNPSIYHEFKQFRSKAITPPERAVSLSAEQTQLIDFILDSYVHLSAFALSAMTHREGPWLNAANGAIITDDAILSYYGQLPFAKNFNDLSNLFDGEYHVLQTESWHAFTMDMTAQDAAEFERYQSYRDYKRVAERAERDVEQLITELFGQS